MSVKSTKRQVQADKTVSAAIAALAPIVSSYTIVGTDDTALDPAGGQTILLKGVGFKPGATIMLGLQAIGVVSYVDTNTLSFTSPAQSAGTYSIYVTNTDYGTGILTPGIIYSTFPTWTTGSGSQGSYYETQSISKAFVATSDSAVTSYTLDSGTLPTGSTLSSSGVLTGTAPVDSGSTTYTFTIKATDSESQDSTRSFSLTINTDVVTWATPENNASYILIGNQPMANVTLSATSAAGYNVTYAANALPTGTTLVSGVISGTPTVTETVSTLLTATAATTNRTATRTISWSVSVGDIYWKNVSLLLRGSTPTPTFINDASLNNSQLTIAGDTKPNNFNPYSEGYYSAYLNGTSTATMTIPSGSQFNMSTGDFSIEMWVYPITQSQYGQLLTFDTGADYPLSFYWGSSVSTPNIMAAAGTTSAWFANTSSMTFGTTVKNQWTHILLTRSGNDWKCFQDGVLRFYTSQAGTVGDSSGNIVIGGPAGTYPTQAYISNLRIIKGSIPTAYQTSTTTVGTTIFTPSTSPLTLTSQGAVAANVSLLTCQDNRAIDKSVYNSLITLNSGASITSIIPFNKPTTTSYNTQYSTYFDGSGDYLSVSYNSGFDIAGGDFTIECWFNFSTLAALNIDSVRAATIATFGPATTNIGWELTVNQTSNTILFSRTGDNANKIVCSYAVALGRWYHIAVVRNSSTNYIYIDGVSQTLTTDSYTGGSATSGSLTVGYAGRFAGYDLYFPGSISNFRIVKGTGITPPMGGPTTPLTLVSGTSLLTCQDATLKDNSTNNFAITSNGQAKPIAVSPFTMTTSSTTLTSLGSAYFDGTGDVLNVPNTGALTFGTGDFTIEYWMNPGTNTTSNRMMGNGAAGSFVAGKWAIWPYTASGKWAIDVYNISSSATAMASTTSMLLNTWYHIAMTRSGNVWRLFVNGVQEATITNSASFDNGTAATITVGGSGFGTESHVGYMSDVRFIKGTALYTSNFLPPQAPLTPITNTQLLTLQYNGGANNNSVVDQSTFNRIVTRTGNPTQGTFSPYTEAGWSYYFPGLSTSYVQIPTSSGAMDAVGDFTMEMWIYVNTFPTDQTVYGTIFGNNSVSGTYMLGLGNTSFSLSAPWYVHLLISNDGPKIKSDTVIVASRWYHIAHTRTSGTNRLFVDGVLQTSTLSDNVSRTFGAGPVYLSKNLGGYISNFRYIKGTSIYTSTFTPSTSPLTSVANTSLLTNSTNISVDSSPNNLAITRTADVTVKHFSPFTITTEYSPSVQGGSVYMSNATANYLTVTDNTLWNTGATTPAFTIEAWVYPIGITGGCIISSMYNASKVPFVLGIGNAVGTLGTTNQVWFGSYNGSWVGSISPTTTQLIMNQWTHVAGVYTGTARHLYINGLRVATATATWPAFDATTTAGYIGKRWDGTGSGADGFNGYISDVRIVKEVAFYTAATELTPTATLTGVTSRTNLLLNFTSGGVIDYRGNSNLETAGNTQLASEDPYGGSYYSNYFDGSGDYLTTPTVVPLTGNFTIEGWLRLDTLVTRIDVFMQNLQGSSSEGRLLLSITSANAYKLEAFVGGTTGAPGAILSSTVIQPGTWYHFAYVRNSNTFSLYINGVREGTQPTGTISIASQAGTIGYNQAQSTYINGYLSNFRICNSAVYTANFTPSTTPLTAISGTSLLTCQSNTFRDNSTNNFTITRNGDTKVKSINPFQQNTGKSLYFDGTGDQLVISSNLSNFTLGTSDFTIEMWVYQMSLSAATLVDFRGAISNVSPSFELSSAGKIFIYKETSGTLVTSTNSITASAWNHIAFTRSGTTVRLFINGVLDPTTATDSTNWLIPSGKLVIGSNYVNSGYITGYLKDLRITKSVARYTTTFTPPTSPLQNK